jgi:hypothetical protein
MMLKLNFKDYTDVDEKHRGATSAASRALLLFDGIGCCGWGAAAVNAALELSLKLKTATS